jgi:hypothetical protein
MKQIIIIAIVFTVLSCGNQKAVIVEEIKAAKDSMQFYKNWESFYSLFGKEMEDKGQAEYSDKRYLKEVPQHVIDNKRWDSARISNYTMSLIWKEKIDSLELELKKY